MSGGKQHLPCEGCNTVVDPAFTHFRLLLHLKKHLASQKFHKSKEVITKSLNVCTRSGRVL
jgi:hypothetical protein